MRSLSFISALFGITYAAEPLIAALGSSYARGPGLTTPIGGYLQESLSEYFETTYNFTNYAQDGSLLNAIVDTQAPQLAGIQPALIFISSGGNDLFYVACLYNPALDACSSPLSYDDWKTRFQNALDAVVSTISNPADVPIYIVDYLEALGPATKCTSNNPACPLTSSDVAKITTLYNDLISWTSSSLEEWRTNNAASNYNTILIPMKEYSQGHEVGSAEPWAFGANATAGAWHPNPAGAQAVAGYIFTHYTENYGFEDC